MTPDAVVGEAREHAAAMQRQREHTWVSLAEYEAVKAALETARSRMREYDDLADLARDWRFSDEWVGAAFRRRLRPPMDYSFTPKDAEGPTTTEE